jgi:hypothetical protein
MPLLPIIGPWLLKRLAGRLGEKWAARLASMLSIALALAVLAGAAWLVRHDGWTDGRAALLAEQAEARARAEAAQRAVERQAEQARRDELKAGAAIDADQQQEKADATKDLPDARPSDRARARVCVELRQQSRAHGRPEPEC